MALHRGRLDPAAVVRHRHREAPVAEGEPHVDLCRLRMAGDVGQRLLEDAVGRDGLRLRQPDVVLAHVERCGDAVPGSELIEMPGDRGSETEMVEDARPQVFRHLADGLDRLLGELDERVADLGEVGRLDAPPDPRRVDLDGRQHAADHVVQLTGKSRTLLLAHAVDVGGELAQLLARSADLAILLHAHGDVDHAPMTAGRPL